ncbi:hypothetical protein M3Y99_01386400 [Aphelenchoides fujianensis]|nr:hypothetical protein M3Y99_01386400 [Aphelenchoides fujianensis]
MKLETPEFRALFTPELQQLAALFAKDEHELRIAGGPVRDLLMGIQPADLDFATTATPDEMKALFEREHVRMLHKRGEEHGTITCRLNDRENFEVTTLRVDVVCDGRRAQVEFTRDWEIDAFRRDLTINSLFLGLDGTVYDYTGGIKDIEERRVAFVGNAVERLQEDYLRILRYFRFFGRIAKTNEHERRNLDAIVECRDGIKNISGERIWTEFRKILVGRMAPEVLRTMLEECGLAELLALPADHSRAQLDEFRRISESVDALRLDDENKLPATVLSCFFRSLEDVDRFRQRTKISNAEQTLCEFLVEQRERAAEKAADFRHFQRLYLDIVHEAGASAEEPARRCCIELLKYVHAPQVLKEFREWSANAQKFPLGGLDLLEAGVPKGPSVRFTLQHLQKLWIESDFTMSAEELIARAKSDKIEAPAGKSNARKRRWVQIS